MATESIKDINTPVCIYFSEGRCLFRGISSPSLSETQGGKPITRDFPEGFPLSRWGKLAERLCRGRLRFGDYRGIYQKANCDQYASSEPDTRLR